MFRFILMLLAILTFYHFFFRLFIDKIIEFRLQKGLVKRLRKEQSIIQWLFYTCFRYAIPKLWLYAYYFSMFSHTVIFVVCISLLAKGEYTLYEQLIKYIFIIEAVCMLFIRILFWTPTFPNIKIERWIAKEFTKKEH